MNQASHNATKHLSSFTPFVADSAERSLYSFVPDLYSSMAFIQSASGFLASRASFKARSFTSYPQNT